MCLVKDTVGRAYYIYERGLLQLPSDRKWAMREASESRTVTDTDSYAFFRTKHYRRREEDQGIAFTVNKESLWQILYQHHNIASRSECDTTVGMELLRSKIAEKLPAIPALQCLSSPQFRRISGYCIQCNEENNQNQSTNKHKTKTT